MPATKPALTNDWNSPAPGEVGGAVKPLSSVKSPVLGSKAQSPMTPAQLVRLKLICPSVTVCGVVRALQLKLSPANETPAIPLLLLVVGVHEYEPKHPIVFPVTATCACDTPATLATMTVAAITFLTIPILAPSSIWRSVAVHQKALSRECRTNPTVGEFERHIRGQQHPSSCPLPLR